MAAVRKITIHISEDLRAAGYYIVSTYVTGDPGVTPGLGLYERLSWTEAVDVMLVLTDENRPGTEAGEAGNTLTLW